MTTPTRSRSGAELPAGNTVVGQLLGPTVGKVDNSGDSTGGSRVGTSVKHRLWQVARAAATPLVPQDYLDMVAPLRNPALLRGRIETISPETRDSATLVIRPGIGWRGHRPGQYVRLGVDVDGVRLWRAYSVTSGPTMDRELFSITVKAIPDGVVSNHLVHRIRPGTVVQLDQAAGDFGLPEVMPAKLLFLTAGSGITPVMGMLRHHLDEMPDVVLVHGAPTRDEVIFGGELRRLAKTGRITLIESHDATDGYLTADRLVELVPDLAERVTLACGPTPCWT